jgi:hypothetical protein
MSLAQFSFLSSLHPSQPRANQVIDETYRTFFISNTFFYGISCGKFKVEFKKTRKFLLPRPSPSSHTRLPMSEKVLEMHWLAPTIDRRQHVSCKSRHSLLLLCCLLLCRVYGTCVFLESLCSWKIKSAKCRSVGSSELILWV